MAELRFAGVGSFIGVVNTGPTVQTWNLLSNRPGFESPPGVSSECYFGRLDRGRGEEKTMERGTARTCLFLCLFGPEGSLLAIYQEVESFFFLQVRVDYLP